MSGREVNSEGHDLIKFTGGQPDLDVFPRQLVELEKTSSAPPSSQGSQAAKSDTAQMIHI